ncbi:unnamed protein product [Schistosoma curassoni]|uniref:Uncharacterized protein n=1 Tax=Schistosoma curassoni TaxID=6186 RepID=A0A3P8FAX8_9TREM|nr:unnamed protein product [Schistosoma curassoni]
MSYSCDVSHLLNPTSVNNIVYASVFLTKFLHSDREIGTYVSDRYSYYAFQFLESVTPSSKRTLYDFSQLCSFSLCQSTVITRSDLFRRDIRRVLVTDFFGSVRHIIPGPVIEISNSTLYENNTFLNTWLKSDRRLILWFFNAPTVDWENLRTELLDNSFEQEPVDVVVTCALVQHVKESTRYDPDTESSLLDLILIHYGGEVTNLDYMPPLGKSDQAVPTLNFHIIVKNEHASDESRPDIWKVKTYEI